MGAAAGYDRAAYLCAAAEALFAVALVNAVAKLKSSALAFGIHIIGNRGAAQADGFEQHRAHGAMKLVKLGGLERDPQTRRMNAGAPQTFVRVDVSHAAQDALVEQKRFYAGAASTQFRAEFLFSGLERIEAEFAEDGLVSAAGQHAHAAEAANVRVAQLAAIVEREKDVSVRDYGSLGRANDELARHSQMDQQRGAAIIGARGLKIEHEKFSVSANGGDATAREGLLQCGRIVDEIGLAEANAENSSSWQDGSQAARNGFDLGKFGHGEDWTLTHRMTMQNLAGSKTSGRGRTLLEENSFLVRG
jgi:hypothetical protein